MGVNTKNKEAVWIDRGIRHRLCRDDQGGILYSYQFHDDDPQRSWIDHTYIDPVVVTRLHEVLE